GEEDAELFFGREEEIAEALERLRGARLLAVLGASGSGKSSLLRAGVLPALRRGALPGSAGWGLGALTPGPRPVETLAAVRAAATVTAAAAADALAASGQALDPAAGVALAERPEPDRLVILVDQLEEVLTLCRDPAERTAFLANLRYAATIPGGRGVVLAS